MFPSLGVTDAPEKVHVPEFLEHIVMPDDTLTGICMRYKVRTYVRTAAFYSPPTFSRGGGETFNKKKWLGICPWDVLFCFCSPL